MISETTQAHGLNEHALELHNSGYPIETVLTFVRRAVRLCPEIATFQTNLGVVLAEMGDREGASRAFAVSISLEPRNKNVYKNASIFYCSISEYEIAGEMLDKALSFTPDDVDLQYDRAMLHLQGGRWEVGLKEFDVRRKYEPENYREAPAPMWKGEDLNGKSIYVQIEQGYGDSILFFRYVDWLKARYPSCTIITCCAGKLTNLLWGYRGIVKFLHDKTPWPGGVDYTVFLASLAQFHGTTTTNIPADPGFIKHRIAACEVKPIPESVLPTLRVGICWTGNPKQIRNKTRSLPLQALISLAEDPRISLYSLQVGQEGQYDLDRIGARQIVCDLSEEAEKGWVETGVILKQLDLVITVCTATVHLAGALGLNCWTLLCKNPYWIWPREGSSTLWYPGMRLFRQKRSGDWSDVVSEVKEALSAFADERMD